MSVTPEEKGSVTPKSKKCLDMKSKTSLLMSPQRTRGSPLSERQNIPSPLRKDKSQISNRLSFTCSKIVQLISKIITSNKQGAFIQFYTQTFLLKLKIIIWSWLYLISTSKFLICDCPFYQNSFQIQELLSRFSC